MDTVALVVHTCVIGLGVIGAEKCQSLQNLLKSKDRMLQEFGILTYSVQLDSAKCVKATFECITHCQAYAMMNILIESALLHNGT